MTTLFINAESRKMCWRDTPISAADSSLTHSTPEKFILGMCTLFNRANARAKVLRWALEMQQYCLTTEYVKVRPNAIYDALSSTGYPKRGFV